LGTHRIRPPQSWIARFRRDWTERDRCLFARSETSEGSCGVVFAPPEIRVVYEVAPESWTNGPEDSSCSHLCSRTRPHEAGLDGRGGSEIRTGPHQSGRSRIRWTGESELLIRWL
jgi:hypothetical protein